MHLIPSIPFGMALAVLVGAVALYRSADDQYYASCAFYPERQAVYEQRAHELFVASQRIEDVEHSRLWCDTRCASRDSSEIMVQEVAGEPAEGCMPIRGTFEWPAVHWVEYYRRSLVKQRWWPLCTCKYGYVLIERNCATRPTTEPAAPGASVAEAFSRASGRIQASRFP